MARKSRRVFRKKRTAFRRKSVFRRRKSVEKPYTLVCKGPYTFPDEYCCKIKYDDMYISSGTTTWQQQWAMNDAHKPDITSAGHKPRYWAQISPIYSKYVVFGCKIELEMVNNSTSAARCALAFSETNLSGYLVESVAETRYAKSWVVGGSNGNNIKRIQYYLSVPKLNGQKHLDSDPYFYANTGASPTDINFVNLMCINVDGSAQNMNTRAVITYYIKFKDLADPGQSP